DAVGAEHGGAVVAGGRAVHVDGEERGPLLLLRRRLGELGQRLRREAGDLEDAAVEPDGRTAGRLGGEGEAGCQEERNDNGQPGVHGGGILRRAKGRSAAVFGVRWLDTALDG